ncbi:MAG TPA: branched chain amino acid aminotransferase [Clostridiales bacterium]|nr:branched chain amino acid aminotransferase [Clostridiales bacterium]
MLHSLQEIRIEHTCTPKAKPAANQLGFGQYFTDHMFIMDYTAGAGWHDPRIIPYGPMAYDPSVMVFHYGQAVFEGLKAYCAEDGRILLFRPEKNVERLNLSSDRLCIPALDEAFTLKAIKKLVQLEQDWIPEAPGTSLYIRPFIIATDPFLGVRPSNTYQFMIILSPVGNYYAEGLNPVKIYVETHYVRSVKGGTGYVKTAGNYAASIKAQEEAHKKGFTQVLWLDGVERKYIEEVGTMNVFFVMGDEVITPALEGSILGGVTRDSAIRMLENWGLSVRERKLAISDVIEAAASGELKEAFGTGTAAVISPIGALCMDDRNIVINHMEIGELSSRLYKEMTEIQRGSRPDPFGWTVEVSR